ncbi:37S ribosomal protein S22 [Actinomortierella ambigua]|uniref:37S ribosomal protein S22 n=1 Tax=Actinomortierella ambigua TaxID=1343610 RepID=A0A9P6Q9A8_9FUNG|nr:37S ribosomal protein S22 [Actinomortierella ambigua]
MIPRPGRVPARPTPALGVSGEAPATTTSRRGSRPSSSPPTTKTAAERAKEILKDFKLAKVDEVEPHYDPSKIIFLDKHGQVTMIPHDDRLANGRSASASTAHEEDMEDDSEMSSEAPFQRGSAEMEYGRKRIGQVDLPRPLQDAIRDVIDENDKELIRTDALRLFGSLRSTSALDAGESGTMAPPKKFKSGSNPDVHGEGDAPIPAHILEYGHRESVAYVAALAPSAYSAAYNVLGEVKKRVPGFHPKTLFDFGTGPGTAIWAAEQHWKGQLEYTGIDSSLPMLEIAENVISSISEEDNLMSRVSLKPFMSYGPKTNKYDIVMSAFALSEITSLSLRRSTLQHLWESTNDMLILVDRGTPNGFRILAEAREQILGLDKDVFKAKPKHDSMGNILPEEEPAPREPAHVLAPCPHDGVCPMYATLDKGSQWCHFSQKVERPDFLRRTKHTRENYEDSKYTYVILRKGPRPSLTAEVMQQYQKRQQDAVAATLAEQQQEAEKKEQEQGSKKKRHVKVPPLPPITYDNAEDMFKASHSWARIVVPPLKKDRHVVVDYCGQSGRLERMVIPKSQGKIVYRDARKAMWGDLFPHEPKNKAVAKEVADLDREAMRRRHQGPTAAQLKSRAIEKEKKQGRKKPVLDEIEERKVRGGDVDKDVFIDL